MKRKIIFCILLVTIFFKASFSQNVPEGYYFSQEIQIRIPLIPDFPRAIVSLSFGIDKVNNFEAFTMSPGFGLILSGTYARIGDRSVGAFGGGAYIRNNFGFKINNNPDIDDDVLQINTAPELSFMRLFGQDENYAILEMASDIGVSYTLLDDGFIFSADIFRFGVRPGQEKILFLASYPKIGVSILQ